jgi:hypothetical protein
LGLCQWFWAVPRLRAFTAEARVASDANAEKQACEISRGTHLQSFDEDDLSPVERVFDQRK